MRRAQTSSSGPIHEHRAPSSAGSTPPPGNTTASGTNAIVAARRSMNTSRGLRTSITVAASRGTAGAVPAAQNPS